MTDLIFEVQELKVWNKIKIIRVSESNVSRVLIIVSL